MTPSDKKAPPLLQPPRGTRENDHKASETLSLSDFDPELSISLELEPYLSDETNPTEALPKRAQPLPLPSSKRAAAIESKLLELDAMPIDHLSDERNFPNSVPPPPSPGKASNSGTPL